MRPGASYPDLHYSSVTRTFPTYRPTFMHQRPPVLLRLHRCDHLLLHAVTLTGHSGASTAQPYLFWSSDAVAPRGRHQWAFFLSCPFVVKLRNASVLPRHLIDKLVSSDGPLSAPKEFSTALPATFRFFPSWSCIVPSQEFFFFKRPREPTVIRRARSPAFRPSRVRYFPRSIATDRSENSRVGQRYPANPSITMCGIIGLVMGDHDAFDSCDAAQDIHESLYYLQHRGQDACGIAVCSEHGRIYMNKDTGLAAKVFNDGKRVVDLPGYMGIGHLRYPTWGNSGRSESQPFFVNAPYGIALAHNGNLINANELRRFLDQEAHRHVNTDSDSELMLSVFANELNETGKARVNENDLFSALERTYKRCRGAWAAAVMIAGFGVVGFRDPNAIRPLVWGSRPSATRLGTFDYMMASESVALRQLGFTNITDVLPGQAILLKKGSAPIFHQIQEPASYSPDIFEYVYFARPDSTIDGISVHKARENQGIKLANKISKTLSKEALDEIDIVIPIPETSNTAAAALATRLQKPFSAGFVKNRYVFRTFIMPGQSMRQKSVRRKLSTIESEFKGKTVLLVDDSIVRGTTSREIVLMAREAGAKKVIFSSSSPEITNSHIYGIDLASRKDLIAYGRNNAEIAEHIGADAVIYQDLDDLIASCAELSPRDPKTQTFEIGVFNGCYVTPVPEGYLDGLNDARTGAKKRKLEQYPAVASGGPTLEAAGDGPAAKAANVNGLTSRPRPESQTAGGRADIGIHNITNDPEN